MTHIIRMTLKGIFRDRIFQGIMTLAILFLFIPTIASLSMRQVTELSITLSLSLISCIMLVLAVFLGATSIWKDIERRYTFSILSLPLTRTSYLMGRFCGVALFMCMTAVFLGFMALLAIKISSMIYPPSKPLLWSAIISSIFFDMLKYVIIVEIAMLFATVSTSFFLPIFGAISTFMAGTITQQVYDYLHTASAQSSVPVFVRKLAMIFYYLIPNLDGFNLKVHAIYALPLNIRGILLTFLYFFVYSAIVMSAAAMSFSRKELK